jgi:hypothetical protein
LAAFADKRLLGLDLDLELTPDLLSGQPFLDWLKLALIRAEQGLGLGNGYGQRKTPGT